MPKRPHGGDFEGGIPGSRIRSLREHLMKTGLLTYPLPWRCQPCSPCRSSSLTAAGMDLMAGVACLGPSPCPLPPLSVLGTSDKFLEAVHLSVKWRYLSNHFTEPCIQLDPWHVFWHMDEPSVDGWGLVWVPLLICFFIKTALSHFLISCLFFFLPQGLNLLIPFSLIQHFKNLCTCKFCTAFCDFHAWF